MFEIDNNKTIHITRGDSASILFNIIDSDGADYVFSKDDVVRFMVYEKGNCNKVVLCKTIKIEEETTSITIELSKEDTRICEPINKPHNYWYEIELNYDTYPQTVVGYDTEGAKIFRLYPEGVPVDE